jgi:hypothetical protein
MRSSNRDRDKGMKGIKKGRSKLFFPSSLKGHVQVVIKEEGNSKGHTENLKWHGNRVPRIYAGL